MPEPWSNPRSTSLWFRKKVPTRLRFLIGKSEIKQTLDTKDSIVAKQKSDALHVEWDRRFKSLMLEHPPLDHFAIDALAREFYESMVERHMREPGAADRWRNRARWERVLYNITPKRHFAKR